MNKTEQVEDFYDQYWPQNIPDLLKTEEYISTLLSDKNIFNYAFDGGCGTGVCSIALASRAKNVVAFDLSAKSLISAKSLAKKKGQKNIEFIHGDLAKIEFPNESFDLVFSWGVVHHCKDPYKVMDELIRICKPGGTIIMGVYMKTSLSWFHEIIRKKICLPLPAIFKHPFIQFVTIFVHIMRVLGKNIQSRDDNHRIASQVEDWFFVPIKHFFTIDEMKNKFTGKGITFELLQARTSRFKACNVFVVRGVKNGE